MGGPRLPAASGARVVRPDYSAPPQVHGAGRPGGRGGGRRRPGNVALGGHPGGAVCDTDRGLRHGCKTRYLSPNATA